MAHYIVLLCQSELFLQEVRLIKFFLTFNTFQKKEYIMKEQKRKEGKEKKEIVVIDKGIDTDAMGARGICCRGPFFAFRG